MDLQIAAPTAES